MSNPVQGPLRAVNPIATVGILCALLLALLVGIAPNLDTRAVELGERFWPGYAAELRTDPVAPDCDVSDLEEQVADCPTGAAPAPDAADPFGGTDPFGEAPAPKPAPDPFAEEDPFAPAPKAAPKKNCTALTNLLATCRQRHETHEATVARITPSVRRFRSFELAVSDMAQFPFGKHLLVLVVILGALSTTAHRMHIALRNPVTPFEHRFAQGGQLLAHLFWLASCFADRQVQAGSAAEAENPMLPVLWAGGFAALVAINLVHLVRPPKDLVPQHIVWWRLPMVIPLYVYMAVIAGVYFVGVEQHMSGQAIFLHKFVQHPTIYTGIGLYIWAGMMLSRTRLAVLGFDVLIPWAMPAALLAWMAIVLAALPTAYSGASGIFVIAAGAVVFERLLAVGAPARMALAATAMSGSLGVVLRPCLVVVLVAVLNKQVTTDELFGWGLWVFVLTAGLAFVAFALWNRDEDGRRASLFGAEGWPLLMHASLLVLIGTVFGGLVLKLWSPDSLIGTSLPAEMWLEVGMGGLIVLSAGVHVWKSVMLQRDGLTVWGVETTLLVALGALAIAGPYALGSTSPIAIAVLGQATVVLAYVVTKRLPWSERQSASGKTVGALKGLAPYFLIAVGVLVFYAVAFKTTVNEHTAPMVLPAVLLALLAWDRLTATEKDFIPALTSATAETSHHTGALLMVMCGSVALGGVVERAEVMSLVPESFGSLWLTMAVLVVIMVLVGMTMDALGAVVLVSVTIATVAYDNGIDPVHFWMVVLVGFELGYLTPPVSLNHLLARQVIGPASYVERVDPKTGFWERFEHLLVPMIIMGTALLIVAFGPLFFY